MRVGIIGGGNGGTSILKTLSKMKEINIAGIIDINDEAPGIQMAKNLNIFSSARIEDLFTKQLDIVIEATGASKVKEEVMRHNKQNVSIMCSKAANLMMHLVENEEKLHNKIEAQLKEVDELTTVTSGGIEKMKSSIENIGMLSNALNQFASRTINLVQETDEIIKIMGRITQQTNILGLNASIEAARAGEQGKGFAVVAKEVQKLASNNEDFTNQISDILNTINQEVKGVSKEIERLNDVSKGQNLIGKDLSEAIDKLKTNIHNA